MPNPQATNRHKPSARRGREAAGERPSARAPVARGVFGHLTESGRLTESPQPLEQAPQPKPTTGMHPRPATEGSVLITGVCGRLGRLLARELHRTDQVVGVDRRPFVDRPKDIVHHQVDMRRKKMKDIFRGRDIRAVVHLGVLHDPRRSERDRHTWNIVAFQKLLDYMSQYEVPKLVVLSGANVYGPQPNNPQFLTEDAPLLGAQHFGGMRDLVELDMLAQSFFWKHPNTETVVLRPCHIVGRVHNAASNYLRLERPVMVMGFDPMMQVVHEKDVVRAIQLALRPGVRGIFNIRGPGEMPLSHLIRRVGGRPRLVPTPLAKVALDQLWRLRLSNFPSPELDHLRYVCMVDDSRARTELGYEPAHSIDRVLKDVQRLRYQTV
jgi:UDP-glucose 4-epimerase